MLTKEEVRKIAIEDIKKNNRNIQETDIKIYDVDKDRSGDWIVTGAIPYQTFTIRISDNGKVITKQFLAMTGYPTRE
jgi:hypothetical protein